MVRIQSRLPPTESATRVRLAPRIRSRRLRADQLMLQGLEATGAHNGLGAFAAQVEDLSLHGMALVLRGAASRGGLAFQGDRLERLTVRAAGSDLYHGCAIVRRVAERGEDLELGIELDASGLDLGEVHRRGARAGFAARWQEVRREAEHADVPPEFKAWVAELRAYLDSTGRFLEAAERSLDAEDLLTRDQARREYLDVVAPDIRARMDRAAAELALLSGDLSEDQHAAYRAFGRAQLQGLFLRAPFMRRALEKPLGYAGDYEMMNMLYRDPAEGETLLGRALNMWATGLSISDAVRNRVRYLGDVIRRAVAAGAHRPLRIASIGCGPARELEVLLSESPELGVHLEIALIDQEERAICHCERALAPLAARTWTRIQFVRESLRTLLSAGRLPHTLGPRELIYSAGLFDYLDDRRFRHILTGLAEAAVPGGQVVIGNMAAGQRDRAVMEYFAEWFLLYRTRDELLALARGLGTAEVAAEPGGINLFLHVRK
jgi:extracellular factor (EF) 3-hydroxypalmitic acid methyl ester biosynthesis protein